MKKKLALLVAGALIAGATLSGCGASTTDTTGTTGTTQDGYTTTTAGTLTMATNAFFEPYEYYEGETIVGIDADVGKAIADKLGLEFKIIDMEFDTINIAVSSGKADMGMAGMTVNEERLKSVDFSQSYAAGVQSIIVTEDSAIATPDDLTGKKIGVQQGTTGDLQCTQDFGESAITRYSKGSDAVLSLMQGKVDCVVIDNQPAQKFAAANTGLKVLDTAYAKEEYAISFAKNNTALKDAVDNALGELIADGTVQTIIDKYIIAE